MYFRRRQARLVEFDKYNQILSNTIRSNFKYHSDDETRRSAAPCQVKISNVYDEELIEGKQVGEGPGCKNEVGEEGEVVGVLVLHDHRHAARLPADVAAISFGIDIIRISKIARSCQKENKGVGGVGVAKKIVKFVLK